jgi:hypothetical protein
VLRIELVNANATARVAGREALPGKSNYLIGNDPGQWRTNVANYAKVEYRDVYPGIDLVYYGNQRELEHDFIVAPGADLTAIKMAFDGAKKISLNSEGDLLVNTEEGDVQLKRPRVYQTIDSKERRVAARYVLKDHQSVGFEVAAYDHHQPLVIDPVLSYSTYLGRSGREDGAHITVDALGNTTSSATLLTPTFPRLQVPFRLLSAAVLLTPS